MTTKAVPMTGANVYNVVDGVLDTAVFLSESTYRDCTLPHWRCCRSVGTGTVFTCDKLSPTRRRIPKESKHLSPTEM